MEPEMSYLMDSVYEMDAPQVADFYNHSVNESIFDKKIVGDKDEVFGFLPSSDQSFRSPSKAFRDIGNITPKGKGNTPISKLKKTPNVMSPLAMPLNRPRTRSMSNTTLTPQAAALATTDPVTPITKPLKRSSTSTPVVEVTRKVTNSLIPDHSTPAVTRSQIQKSMEAAKPVSPVTQAQLDRSPTKSLKRKSTSHESLPGASPPKRAPVRPPMAPAGRTALRTRIDSAKPLRARTSSSSGPVRQSRSPVKGLRQRTNSSNGQTSLRQRTSSSDSSSSLSSLMRPTASALLKQRRSVSSSNLATAPGSAKKQPSLTKPTTPNCLKHRSRLSSTSLKTTAQLQQEAIEKEKAELMALRRQNAQALKALPLSARKERPPASKTHNMVTRSSTDGSTRPPAAKSLYSRSRHASQESEHSGPKSLARTPSPSPAKSIYQPRITRPISPKFSNIRERKATVLSAAEREELELKAAQEKQFKARPLDKRILEQPVGIGLKAHIPPTKPMDVHFASDNRIAAYAERQHSRERETEPSLPPKVCPPPKSNIIFKPRLEHRATKPQPFSLEAKEEEARKRKAELVRLAEEEARKLRQFIANPLPPSPSPLPERQRIPATQPKPFNLLIDERGQAQQEKLKRKIEAEQARMIEQAQVVAKPAEVLTKKPFVPKKVATRPTEPMDIELHSAKRAQEREEYEQQKAEYEESVKAVIEEQKRRQEREERRQMLRQRAETVIKQNPIKQYKPIQIQKSDKPLTKPRSPQFSKK